MIRVLLAGGAPAALASMRAALDADARLDVVAAAPDASGVHELLARLQPDVVVLDEHIPPRTGLAVVREIMARAPRPVVLAVDAARAGDATLVAAAADAGALTVLARPAAGAAAATRFADVVRSMADVKVVRRRAAVTSGAVARPGVMRARTPAATAGAAWAGPAPRAIAIGASTGGPQALRELLGHLPGDCPAPVLVVQHLATGFVPELVAWLDRHVALRVKRAEDGERLRAGTVYVAPDDHHLIATPAHHARLDHAPPVDGFRPSATVLFASVASSYAAAGAGVILTGMGRDGVDGLVALRAAGGLTLAQDEHTSVVYGMPGAAVDAGAAGEVLPLDALAGRLWRALDGGPSR